MHDHSYYISPLLSCFAGFLLLRRSFLSLPSRLNHFLPTRQSFHAISLSLSLSPSHTHTHTHTLLTSLTLTIPSTALFILTHTAILTALILSPLSSLSLFCSLFFSAAFSLLSILSCQERFLNLFSFVLSLPLLHAHTRTQAFFPSLSLPSLSPKLTRTHTRSHQPWRSNTRTYGHSTWTLFALLSSWQWR